MFGGRFGLTRFSLRDTVDMTIPIVEAYFETGRGLISLGSVVDIDEAYRCRAESSIIAVRGVPTIETYRELANAQALAGRDVFVEEDFNEMADASIDISSVIFMSEEYSEIADVQIFIAVNIYFEESMREAGSISAYGGIEFNFAEAFREIGFAAINATAIEMFVITISATIPAGGELRIDGENYNVLLNGANIIHTHSGEWPMIDRHTVAIALTAGSSAALTGQILYNERYL